MSQDDPNFKRLSTIIIMFVFMIMISACSTVFLQGNEGLYDNTIGETKNIGAFDVMVNVLGFFIGVFIVDIIDFPPLFYFIMMPIYLIGLITFWYLVLDFLKDIEIFGTSI